MSVFDLLEKEIFMGRFLLILVLFVCAAGLLVRPPFLDKAAAQAIRKADAAVGMATAQVKADPEPTSKDPAEALGKLTLTLDVGGHTHDIKKMVFTPDNKHIVSGSADGALRIWDLETGRSLRVLYPPERRTNGLFALSPDGQHLAVVSAGKDGQLIYLMNFADGRIEGVLKGLGWVHAVAYAADGKRLASCDGDNVIRIWDIGERKMVQEFTAAAPTKPANPVIALAFSPDGEKLLVFHVKTNCHVRELATGKSMVLAATPAKHINWPSYDKVAWSPDGKTIAASGQDGVRLWSADGKLRLHLAKNEFAHNVAFSADSRRVIANIMFFGTGARSIIFDVQSGKQLAEFTGKASGFFFPWTSAISPGGELAATATGGGNSRIFVWKSQNGAQVKQLGVRSRLTGSDLTAGWSGNGKTILWRDVPDPATWKGGPTSFNLAQLEFGPPRSPKVIHGTAQQGALALRTVGDDAVQVLKNGKPLSLLKQPNRKGPRVLTLVGQDRAALCYDTYGFALYDISTGKLVRWMKHPGWVSSLAPSPDGRLLLSLSEDQTLRVWDTREGHMLLTMYVTGNDWIAWTPNGYYAATPGGERLMGWTVDNGPDKETTFSPADRFRKHLYRPDIIKLVIEKASVKDAVLAADAAEGTITRDVNVADLLPPRALLTVLDQSKLPTVRLKVHAEAAAKNQPITALRLLVDGRPLADGLAYTTFDQAKESATTEWSITLPPGKHQLTVLARCADASSKSNSIDIVVNDPAKQNTLHVLAVGVSDYEDGTLKLDFAAKDAEDIAANFPKCCKGELFHDVRSEALVNGKARKAGILKRVAEMRKQVRPNDLVVIFFAGHGVKEKNRFYLLPVEARIADLARTAISSDELRKSLGEFPCQVLLMLDACHSSAGLKNFRPAVDDITRNLTDDDCGVAVLCSAMAHEKAIEKDGNGLFTRAVLDGLSRKEGVPFNTSSRLFYVHHLHSYVFDRVSDLSGGRQHPFLSLPWVVESFPVAQFEK